MRYCFFGIALLFLIAASLSVQADSITESQLRAKVEAATKGLTDLSIIGSVKEKNKQVLTKVDPKYAQLYEFKSVNIFIKVPDKIRFESKLGMVKFEYIINGGKKIVRSKVYSQTSDYSNDPAKLQSPFDVGLITPSLWQGRKVEIMDDPDAKKNGEIKLKLSWMKGDMVHYAWIDAKDLWLKRFEKYDSKNNLQVKVVYSNPEKIGGIIWMPKKIELFSADGQKAGMTEFTSIKINSGIPDTLFQ